MKFKTTNTKNEIRINTRCMHYVIDPMEYIKAEKRELKGINNGVNNSDEVKFN